MKLKFDYKKLNLLKINENQNLKRKLLYFSHSKQWIVPFSSNAQVF
jgi:hypothetical protein